MVSVTAGTPSVFSLYFFFNVAHKNVGFTNKHFKLLVTAVL